MVEGREQTLGTIELKKPEHQNLDLLVPKQSHLSEYLFCVVLFFIFKKRMLIQYPFPWIAIMRIKQNHGGQNVLQIIQ